MCISSSRPANKAVRRTSYQTERFYIQGCMRMRSEQLVWLPPDVEIDSPCILRALQMQIDVWLSVKRCQKQLGLACLHCRRRPLRACIYACAFCNVPYIRTYMLNFKITCFVEVHADAKHAYVCASLYSHRYNHYGSQGGTMMASSKQCTLNTVLIEWMQTELLMLVCMRCHPPTLFSYNNSAYHSIQGW